MNNAVHSLQPHGQHQHRRPQDLPSELGGQTPRRRSPELSEESPRLRDQEGHQHHREETVTSAPQDLSLGFHLKNILGRLPLLLSFLISFKYFFVAKILNFYRFKHMGYDVKVKLKIYSQLAWITHLLCKPKDYKKKEYLFMQFLPLDTKENRCYCQGQDPIFL